MEPGQTIGNLMFDCRTCPCFDDLATLRIKRLQQRNDRHDSHFVCLPSSIQLLLSVKSSRSWVLGNKRTKLCSACNWGELRLIFDCSPNYTKRNNIEEEKVQENLLIRMFTIDEWETTNKTVHEPQYSPVQIEERRQKWSESLMNKWFYNTLHWT